MTPQSVSTETVSSNQSCCHVNVQLDISLLPRQGIYLKLLTYSIVSKKPSFTL